MASPGEVPPNQPFEGFYTTQDDLWSAHYLFPRIGKESREAFCQYLQYWGLDLPLLNDGYEKVLKLQALVWQEFSRVVNSGHLSPGPSNAAQSYRWKNDQNLAEHVERVTHALEGRGSGRRYQTTGDVVFIVHDDSKKACNNPSCPDTRPKALGQAQTSQAITLEPLLDWGTVEPALDVLVASGRIFPFRRNGPRMDDPLWTQAVRKLVPQQPRTYCLDCIEELMNRQMEAGHHYSPIQPIRRPTSRSEMYDLREGCDLKDDWSVEGQASFTASSLYLDGVADETLYTGSASGPFGSQRLPHCFTPPPDPSSLNGHHLFSFDSFSNNPRPPTPVTPKNRVFVYRDPKSVLHEDYEKLGSKALLPGSVPDFGSGNRRFGRDIDANVVSRFFTNHRIRRENMAKAKDTDIRNYFTVINPNGSSTPQRVVKTSNLNYNEADLSDVLSDLVNEEDDSDATGAEYTPIKNKGKVSSKSISPNSRTPSPKKKILSPSSKPRGKAPAPHAPIHRKRDPATDNSAPFGVTQAAFQAHLRHFPSKTDIICSCRKPARTNDVQITQCANKDCRVRWYHKDCLDRIGKLKSRHGTYLCEQCQNEKHYANLSRASGWSTERLVQDEIGMPVTGQEIAGIFGDTGDFQATTNPYGLATSTTADEATIFSPFAKSFIPSAKAATGAMALSRLAVGSEPSLGLEISRPYFLTEAYTRGKEHTHIADEEYERAQVYGFYSGEWHDEIGEDGDDEQEEEEEDEEAEDDNEDKIEA